jgi:hypothetical protein
MALAADQRKEFVENVKSLQPEVRSLFRVRFIRPRAMNPAAADHALGLSLVVPFVRLRPSVDVRRFETRASVTAPADGGAIQKIGTQ